MSSRAADLSPLAHPADGMLARPLPWSRAAALQNWSRAILLLCAVQVAAIALGAAFQSHDSTLGEGTVDPTVHSLLAALFLPLFLVSLARYTERRLHRPPKRLLLAQFVIYCASVLTTTVSTLDFQATGFGSPNLFRISHGLLALSILIPAVWSTGALLASPAAD